MEIECILKELINIIVPLFSMLAALASAYAVFKTNQIAKSARDFQKNTILNQRQIELVGKALEKLTIYNVWCKSGGAGDNINYHDSDETEYESRDEAFLKIPKDLKLILIKLSSYSKELEKQVNDFQKGFIINEGDDYFIDENKISEKVETLRVMLDNHL